MDKIIGLIYYGNTYLDLWSTGSVSNKTNPKPTNEWKILGAVRYNNFGNEVERKQFNQLKELNGIWHHKNGTQKWHIVDHDHGSKRIWMNPIHKITIFDTIEKLN